MNKLINISVLDSIQVINNRNRSMFLNGADTVTYGPGLSTDIAE